MDFSGIWIGFGDGKPVDRLEMRRDGSRYYVIRPPGNETRDDNDYFDFDGTTFVHLKGPKLLLQDNGEAKVDSKGRNTSQGRKYRLTNLQRCRK